MRHQNSESMRHQNPAAQTTARQELMAMLKASLDEQLCYLGFGTLKECPNQCKGVCGYTPIGGVK